MQKPLSPKTLEKRYAELGLSDAKLQLLHTFFRCASNFYGVLPVSNAWQVFKHYEGLRVHKKDFVAFSGVAQRDASLPYAIYELRELYSDEPGGAPLDRTIVNKDMVMHGYYRFLYVYNTLENQRRQSFLVPDQEIFLSFAEDRFYLTPQGKAMVDFIGGLRAGGTQRRWNGEVIGPMLDLNGEPALGKRLSGLLYRTQSEEFEIDISKRESEKRRLERESAALAADKVLRRMRVDIMTGFMEPDEEFDLQVRILNEDYDVQLSKKQTDKFRRLFMDLYLQSSLWQLGGWTAVSLFYSGAAYGPERRPTSEKVRKATPPDADKLVELRGRLGPDWPKLPKS